MNTIKRGANLCTPALLFPLLLLLASPNASAQNFTTDVIVQGNIGVGIDSNVGQSFGFDTMILKENNLRVLFDDTSASASFAGNDWRFTINDSGDGGANFFSIDDATAGKQIFRVDAGAPANALRVKSSGNVGIGEDAPVVNLHVTEGDSPTLRLEQDGSSGFTTQTWDVAGNETNFFVRDVTNGSKLPFKIVPGTPNNTIYLHPNGVGIGNANPQAKLHVTGAALIEGTLEIGSSRDLKENIKELTLEEARATLRQLNPVRFNYKIGGETQIGFIAEDVPDLVATKNRRSIVPMDFVGVLTKVVQDYEVREKSLREQLRSQEEMVKTQEQLLNDFAGRLEKLEERTGAGAPDAARQTPEGH